MTTLARATDPQTREIARRLAGAVGVTYDALDDEQLRGRFLDLAEEVVAIIGDDDYHMGCYPQEALDDARSKAAETGFRRGVELGLEQAKARMTIGLDKLQAAGLAAAGPASEVRERIRTMGVDWAHPTVQTVDGDEILEEPEE